MTNAPFRHAGRLLERIPVEDATQVYLQQIAPNQWRALDGRLSSDDVRALLGFVEGRGDDFAVTLIDEPGRITVCRNLDNVRELFVSADIELHATVRDGAWARLARHYHSNVQETGKR